MAEIYRPDPNGKKPERPKEGEKKKLTPRGRALLAVTIVAGTALLLFGLYHLIIEYYTRMIQPPPTDEIYVTQIIEPTSETETMTQELPTVQLEEHNGELNLEGLPLICDTHAVTNILLIGIDARAKENEAGLSDTMMILSINTDKKTISLNSIERDTLVKIPDHGQNKLNAAHAFGGADLLLQTYRENFNIDIQYWARVNFYSFVDIVDAVGGLDVEMTASEIHYMNFYLLEINELYERPRGTDNLAEVAGTYHLNGYQALGFCRNRYTDNDFGRMSRQRKVIDLIIQKAKTLNVVQLDHLLTTVLPMVTSNMPQDVRHALAASAPTYLFYQLKTGSVPEAGDYSYGKTPAGASVVVLSNKKNSFTKLYTAIYGENPDGTALAAS